MTEEYGGLTLVIETNGKDWYWAMYFISGKVSHFSPMYSSIEAVVDSAKAHIYNMNHPQVICLRFDKRVVPNTLEKDIPDYELYFRSILKTFKSISETVKIPENDTIEPEIKTPQVKKNHLTLIQ